MTAIYHTHTDSLDDRFITNVKAMFPKRSITISVRGASEREHSETDYLLKTADNRRHIEASLIQLDGGYEVVKYTPEDLVRLA